MTAAPEVTQMTIRELADFTTSLAESIRREPDAEKLRSLVEEALTAECVQCAMPVAGQDLLKLAEAPPDTDPKIERLRAGYCARNGCDSHFYRITLHPHPKIDWLKLLNLTQHVVETSVQRTIGIDLASMARGHRNIIRTATIIGALLLVIILRQIYFGRTIPFIREPENFQVDRAEPSVPAVDPR